MVDEFYTMPLPLRAILERRDFQKCELKTSVRQRIHLILVTFFGESRFDEEFGCSIWEHDFENISNMNTWPDKVSKSILESLAANEKRIDKIKVGVEIKEEEIADARYVKVKQIRRRLDVNITARLVKTNELFDFSEPIYVSPISLD
jgi:phage baseplate assembly protein W